MKHEFFIPFLMLALLAFKKDKSKYSAPPNMLPYIDGFYIDKEPVNNFSYKEFLDFLKNNYGSESVKYKAMLPKPIKCTKDTVVYDYLNNSSFMVLPVLGVCKEQAWAYTKWRQDRVLEYQLFKRKMVTKKNDTSFTTENYFNGKVKNSYVDKSFRYYEFSIPNENQLQFIDEYNNNQAKNYIHLKKYNSFVASDGKSSVPVYYLVVSGKNSKKYILKWNEIKEYEADSKFDYELKTFRNIAVLKTWSEK